MLASEGTSYPSTDVIPNEKPSFSGINMHACMYVYLASVLCIFLYQCFEGSTNKCIICSSLKWIKLFGKVCQEKKAVEKNII